MPVSTELYESTKRKLLELANPTSGGRLRVYNAGDDRFVYNKKKDTGFDRLIIEFAADGKVYTGVLSRSSGSSEYQVRKRVEIKDDSNAVLAEIIGDSFESLLSSSDPSKKDGDNIVINFGATVEMTPVSALTGGAGATLISPTADRNRAVSDRAAALDGADLPGTPTGAGGDRAPLLGGSRGARRTAVRGSKAASAAASISAADSGPVVIVDEAASVDATVNPLGGTSPIASSSGLGSAAADVAAMFAEAGASIEASTGSALPSVPVAAPPPAPAAASDLASSTVAVSTTGARRRSSLTIVTSTSVDAPVVTIPAAAVSDAASLVVGSTAPSPTAAGDSSSSISLAAGAPSPTAGSAVSSSVLATAGSVVAEASLGATSPSVAVGASTSVVATPPSPTASGAASSSDLAVSGSVATVASSVVGASLGATSPLSVAAGASTSVVATSPSVAVGASTSVVATPPSPTAASGAVSSSALAASVGALPMSTSVSTLITYTSTRSKVRGANAAGAIRYCGGVAKTPPLSIPPGVSTFTNNIGRIKIGEPVVSVGNYAGYLVPCKNERFGPHYYNYVFLVDSANASFQQESLHFLVNIDPDTGVVKGVDTFGTLSDVERRNISAAIDARITLKNDIDRIGITPPTVGTRLYDNGFSSCKNAIEINAIIFSRAAQMYPVSFDGSVYSIEIPAIGKVPAFKYTFDRNSNAFKAVVADKAQTPIPLDVLLDRIYPVTESDRVEKNDTSTGATLSPVKLGDLRDSFFSLDGLINGSAIRPATQILSSKSASPSEVEKQKIAAHAIILARLAFRKENASAPLFTSAATTLSPKAELLKFIIERQGEGLGEPFEGGFYLKGDKGDYISIDSEGVRVFRAGIVASTSYSDADITELLGKLNTPVSASVAASSVVSTLASSAVSSPAPSSSVVSTPAPSSSVVSTPAPSSAIAASSPASTPAAGRGLRRVVTAVAATFKMGRGASAAASSPSAASTILSPTTNAATLQRVRGEAARVLVVNAPGNKAFPITDRDKIRLLEMIRDNVDLVIAPPAQAFAPSFGIVNYGFYPDAGNKANYITINDSDGITVTGTVDLPAIITRVDAAIAAASLAASTPPSVVASTPPSVVASTPPSVVASTPPSVVASTPPSVVASASPSVVASTPPSVVASTPPSVVASASPSVVASASPSIVASASPSVAASASPSVAASASPSVAASTPPISGSAPIRSSGGRTRTSTPAVSAPAVSLPASAGVSLTASAAASTPPVASTWVREEEYVKAGASTSPSAAAVAHEIPRSSVKAVMYRPLASGRSITVGTYDRGDNFRVIDGVYDVSGDDADKTQEKAEIAQTFRNIIAVAADKAGLDIDQVQQAIAFAKSQGGLANEKSGSKYKASTTDFTGDEELNKKFKRFSAIFQKQAAAVGIYTGRESSRNNVKPVGLRLAFVPNLKDIDKIDLSATAVEAAEAALEVHQTAAEARSASIPKIPGGRA